MGIDQNEKMVLMTERYSDDENGKADFLEGVVTHALRTQKKISRKDIPLVSGNRVLAEEYGLKEILMEKIEEQA